MERRAFLTSAALAAATGARSPAAESSPARAGAGLIDTNVYSGPWTIRNSPLDTPARLAEKLRRHGVTAAWVGSFEGVLHSDIAGVNTRLAEACARERGLLHAFGTINPTLPDWEDDLRRCHEVHHMPGVRLFPNYHGYALDDPRFARLVELSVSRRLLVQIALSLEDDRSQNPALTALPVPPAPLADLVTKFPAARFMLLNGSSRLFGTSIPLLQRLAKNRVWVEIATLETVAGIAALLQRVPDLKLCFGSHTPYFYFEAALLKLQESALTPEQLAAVSHLHARAALEVA